MAGPGGVDSGAYGIPWTFLTISGIAYVAIIVILYRSRRLRAWLTGVLNRSLDSKRKDKNWGKWMP